MFSLRFRNLEGIEESHVDFIPIFVYDNDLRQYVRNHLKRLDFIRVEGSLKYKTTLNNKEKYMREGYIVPKKIMKVVSVHKLAENKENKSITKSEFKKDPKRRSNVNTYCNEK